MRAVLLVCFLPFLSVGQIILQQADFADGGDVAVMSLATDLGIDYSSTGANWTWDFSTLIAESQDLREFTSMSNAPFIVDLVYGPFAPSSYQASYFTENDDIPLDLAGSFLPVSITDIYQYSKVSSSAINSLGFALAVNGVDIPYKSDTIETRYELPLSYQDTYTSNGYTNIDANPIQDFIWRQYRTRSSEVDGWGSITTPLGTFQSLRIKHTITEIDSIYLDAFGVSTWIPIPVPDSYIYEWWTNGEKDAVLRIETSSLAGIEVVSSIEFRDIVNPELAISEQDEVEVRLYPNPVVDELHIQGFDFDAVYLIIDQAGKVVGDGIVGSSGSISTSGFCQGTYMLLVHSEGQLARVPFLKE